MARRGPKPKAGGRRQQLLTRLPDADAECYRQAAAATGLAVSDWIALQLAAATGRPAPDYVTAALSRAVAVGRRQDEPRLFAEAC